MLKDAKQAEINRINNLSPEEKEAFKLEQLRIKENKKRKAEDEAIKVARYKQLLSVSTYVFKLKQIFKNYL